MCPRWGDGRVGRPGAVGRGPAVSAEAEDDVRGAADQRFGIGIRHEIAAQHLEEGRAKDAIAILRKLLKQDSSFIPAHITLGEALHSQGHAGRGLDRHAGLFACPCPFGHE